MQDTYFATLDWDADAGVWYISDTDFPGLVAEAASQSELVAKVRELVPELYNLNRNLFDDPPPETIPIRMQSNRLENIRLAG